MSPPVLALRDAEITFGGDPLFSGVNLSVTPGDKICLVGRNGSGKSTVLKALAGLIELDDGERFTQPGTTVAYMPQDPKPDPEEAIADYIAGGLPNDDREQKQFRVRDLLSTMLLDGEAKMGTLSGGGQRRAALARAFVSDPDVLLLDEPTNHLDLSTTLWLEKHLSRMPTALLLISHDRAFLRSVSQKTFWMDRGQLRASNQGYAKFDEWAEEILEAEEASRRRLEKRIQAETQWLHRGVTARRKRNQGRLRELQKMRERRAKQIGPRGKAQIELEDGPPAGRRVAEARGISKAYGDNQIVTDFTTRIMRGDRIGIVGPNGAGKTTLIKLLTGEIKPDSGNIKLGTNLEIAYFDQNRDQLNPKLSLWETLTDKDIGGGGDSVVVNGGTRHVVGYLKDFLFEAKQAKQPVGALSGGEKNRLLLAKLFTKPSNLLILDEPTNDLDMDMLDVLEETLDRYEGTILLVSHDRDFLDRLVSSVISFDPDGQVREYAGGYTDMLHQRKTETRAQPTTDPSGNTTKPRGQTRPVARMTYNEQRELEFLPEQMAALERDIAKIEAQLADPAGLNHDPEKIAKFGDLLARAHNALSAKQERWLELELKREELEGAA
ncbi:MAG: ABC-F family ATP-binding cassette domain-containing protein [Alphaproteobacteria bacterium]